MDQWERYYTVHVHTYTVYNYSTRVLNTRGTSVDRWERYYTVHVHTYTVYNYSTRVQYLPVNQISDSVVKLLHCACTYMYI